MLPYIRPYSLALRLKLLPRGTGLLVPLGVLVVIVQPLELICGLHIQRAQSVFLKIVPCHPDRLEIAQILYLLCPLVCHGRALGYQLLVEPDARGASLAADHQPVVAPSLIVKADIISQIAVDRLFIVYDAHIIAARGHQLEIYVLFVRIEHIITDGRSLTTPDDPTVDRDGIFTNPYYVYLVFQKLILSSSTTSGRFMTR